MVIPPGLARALLDSPQRHESLLDSAQPMSPYQLFRLGRLLLLMLLGAVFLALARGRPLSRRFRFVVLALLAISALGYVNFGFFHPGRGHVHYWDAFHYFMGAKYLPELGYSKLYEATYVAGRELESGLELLDRGIELPGVGQCFAEIVMGLGVRGVYLEGVL